MKEEYIKMRNSGQFDIGWFYRYYKDNGGTADMSVFQMVFNLDNEVLNTLDKKFDLNVVQDKNGNFIKVVL
jgi:hypothetical protein